MEILENRLNETKSRRALISWTFYDWANSAFSAIIQTFVFAAYFTSKVAENSAIGTAQWGATMSAAGLLIAIGSPILGSLADAGGHRKRWIGVFTLLCAITTALLWFIKPDPSYVYPAMILVALATVASEFSYVFYNSMLPALAPPDQIGRWSGWGWAMGYVGGTLSLVLALYLFILHGGAWHGLDPGSDQELRATCLLTAGWYLVFSLPLFLFTKDVSAPAKKISDIITSGLRQLKDTILHVRKYRQIALFLLAHIFYIDGLTTLFTFGGVYAAAVFQLSDQDIIVFGIALNLVGGLGAALFALVDDIIGGKRTIILSLCGLLTTATIALSVGHATLFWIFGLAMGLFVGPIQASTRSFMARVAPPELTTQMFGFLALTGKATAFLGPALVSYVTYTSGSQRLGMSPIIVMLFIGLSIMLFVKKDK